MDRRIVTRVASPEEAAAIEQFERDTAPPAPPPSGPPAWARAGLLEGTGRAADDPLPWTASVY